MVPHRPVPRLASWWVIGALCLVIAPQLLRVPAWTGVLISLCLLWRVTIDLGRVGFPNKIVKTLIVVAAVSLTITHYRDLGGGLDAAVSLLLIGAVFKLLEMRQARDMLIVVSLCYLLILVAFIYSQSILSAVHALLSFVVTTAALISLQRSNARNSIKGNAHLAAKLVAQSIPLTLVLFVLVPRIAPLWTMPLPAPSSKTGVTDEMSPGNISSLSRSAALAFRVSFDADTPGREALYWRGLVLDFFDGRAWRRAGPAWSSYAMSAAEQSVQLGDSVSYDVILEPTQQAWIYALQLGQVSASDIRQDRNYTLHRDRPITQRYRYQVRSYLDNTTDVELPSALRRRALQLPANEINPMSAQLAAQFRAQSSDDHAYALRVLRYFREEAFYYTLTPPTLGEASIDEFLFASRQGFCEHYASSYVYLMRAAGIPARVVVGYQGGEVNPFEGYTMVYQYNAHAWAEVWLEGRGWVRFDPTGAVAPERISEGARAVLGDQPGFLEDSRFSMMRFRNTQWLDSLRLRLDAIDYAWNRWVVSYDEDLQLRLLDRLFGAQVRNNLYFVLLGVFALFFAGAAFLLLRGRRQYRHERATRLYLRLLRDFAATGLIRQRGEGPLDFCERVCRQRPEHAQSMRQITALYVHLTYAEGRADGVQEEERRVTYERLRKKIRALRLRLYSPFKRQRV